MNTEEVIQRTLAHKTLADMITVNALDMVPGSAINHPHVDLAEGMLRGMVRRFVPIALKNIHEGILEAKPLNTFMINASRDCLGLREYRDLAEAFLKDGTPNPRIRIEHKHLNPIVTMAGAVAFLIANGRDPNELYFG